MPPSNVEWFHYLVAFNNLAWLTAFYLLISRGIAWYVGASAGVALYWAIVGTMTAFSGYLVGVGLITTVLFQGPLRGAQFWRFIWVWPWPVWWGTFSLGGAIGGAILGATRQKVAERSQPFGDRYVAERKGFLEYTDAERTLPRCLAGLTGCVWRGTNIRRI
jgi:hypothetical protein